MSLCPGCGVYGDGSQLVLIGVHRYGELWVTFLDAATLTSVGDPIVLGAADVTGRRYVGG